MKKMLGVVVLVLVITGHLVGVGAQPRPPIKIGFTADLTGIAAQPAKDMVNGFTMYLDEEVWPGGISQAAGLQS